MCSKTNKMMIKCNNLSDLLGIVILFFYICYRKIHKTITMKKSFTKLFVLGMMMLFGFTTESDAQKVKCLREINSEMEGDYSCFRYNSNGTLDSVYTYSCYYDEESYRLYKYDDKGNMILEEGFCVLPSSENGEFSKSFEVQYGFDDQNHLITRKNYNLDTWGGTNEFILGGVYVYDYNEKGLLEQRRLYWDEAMTDLYETTNYTYNDKNQLIKASYLTSWFGEESEDMYTDYYYNDLGKLIKRQTFSADYDTGEMKQFEVCLYDFDENGNLLTRITYDAVVPEIPSEKHVLVYNTDLTAEDVAFPINHEDDMDFYINSFNVVKTDTIYRRDLEDVTHLFDVQQWVYEDIDASTGIEKVGDDRMTPMRVFKDNEGNLIVEGLESSESVRIYDAGGKMISNTLYNGKVNIGSLPQGVYILMTRQSCLKFKK